MKYVSVAAVGLCRLFFVLFYCLRFFSFLHLYHFLLPLALSQYGGFNPRQNINRFTTYQLRCLGNNTQFIIVDRRRELK